MNDEELEIVNCCLHCHSPLGEKFGNDIVYYQNCSNCKTTNYFENERYSIVTFIAKFRDNPVDVTWYEQPDITIVTLIKMSEDKKVVLTRDKVLVFEGHSLTPQNLQEKLPIYYILMTLQQIPCHFCKSLVEVNSVGSATCPECNVTMVFKYDTFEVATTFFDHILNNKIYTVWLNLENKTTKISLVLEFDWNEIFVMEFAGFPLTPQNIKSKLPIYLLLS